MRRVSTSRLETFSDGVFAIAATLLILNVHARQSHLGHALARAWPSYAAYAVSFITIGIMWANHHGVFSQIDKVDRTFLLINVFFLMAVAFVPFPTVLVAEHLRDPDLRPAALAYGFTLTVTAVALQPPVVLRGGRSTPSARRCRSPGGVGHHPQLPPGSVDLPDRHAAGVLEADLEHRALRRHRRFLHARERAVRAAYDRGRLGTPEARAITQAVWATRPPADLSVDELADEVGMPVVPGALLGHVDQDAPQAG